MRTPEDLNRYGGLSVPSIVIVCPLQGKPEIQLIASTKEERQALRLDLCIDEAKALLVAHAMVLAELVSTEDDHDDEEDEEAEP